MTHQKTDDGLCRGIEISTRIKRAAYQERTNELKCLPLALENKTTRQV